MCRTFYEGIVPFKPTAYGLHNILKRNDLLIARAKVRPPPPCPPSLPSLPSLPVPPPSLPHRPLLAMNHWAECQCLIWFSAVSPYLQQMLC